MATPLRLHPFFLFVIAMNCLSILLNRAAQQGEFGYHHLCEETKLTHLCFADDLLILTEGSTRSIKRVLEVLQNFEAHSGLGISVSKSCFFTSGLSQQEIELLQRETGLSHGTLPIRYLRVPLCTKKLTMANCEPLILNVKAKLNSWSARSLSFAGRLLLINTVISGITNFWCDTFTLPKFCIKLINSLCGAYMWKGTVEGHHSARVDWDQITHAKEEGGLGVRDLLSWNKAASIKLIWMLFFSSGSIWVAWFTDTVLSGSFSNFCRFWSDNWSPYGCLSDFLNLPPTSRLGIPRNATLAGLNDHGNWLLPAASALEPSIKQSNITIRL